LRDSFFAEARFRAASCLGSPVLHFSVGQKTTPQLSVDGFLTGQPFFPMDNLHAPHPAAKRSSSGSNNIACMLSRIGNEISPLARSVTRSGSRTSTPVYAAAKPRLARHAKHIDRIIFDTF